MTKKVTTDTTWNELRQTLANARPLVDEVVFGSFKVVKISAADYQLWTTSGDYVTSKTGCDDVAHYLIGQTRK